MTKITRVNLFDYLSYDLLDHYSLAGKSNRRPLADSPFIMMIISKSALETEELHNWSNAIQIELIAESWTGADESLATTTKDFNEIIKRKRQSVATVNSVKRRKTEMAANEEAAKASEEGSMEV